MHGQQIIKKKILCTLHNGGSCFEVKKSRREAADSPSTSDQINERS